MAYTGKEVLEALKLESYHPAKLSYKYATQIQDDTTDTTGNCRYGVTLANRLLKSDFHALEEIGSRINEINRNKEGATQGHQDTSPTNDFCPLVIIGSTSRERFLNPMDSLTTLLSCSDHILKQILLEKLVYAKLAVPVLLNPILNDSASPLMLNSTLGILFSELPESIMEQKPLIKISNPIFSFIRAGNLRRSKSKVLSSLLNKTTPCAFHHRESFHASARRGPSNGGIEAAWYRSSTSPDADYRYDSHFFTILNLRGNATEFPKQTQLLCESSSLVVIMTQSVDALSFLVHRVLNNVRWNGAKVAITVENSSHLAVEVRNILRTSSFSEHIFQINLESNDVESTNFTEWRAEMKKTLENFLNGNQPKKYLTLGEFFERSKSMGYTVEDDEIIDNARQSATTFVNYLHETQSHHQSSAFPLQGETIKKISKLEKKKLRCSSTDLGEESRIVLEIRAQRTEQCRIIQEFSDPVRSFYRALYSLEGNDFVECVTFVKLGLNEKPGYGKEESLGVEKFLSELGQIYEAEGSRSFSEMDNSESFLQFHEIREFASKAAETLLLGHPLELINGDTSYLPRNWLRAVFKEIAFLTQNRRVFVLSIMGVQSSGKSTLLNALFGLRFPTSSGRCTKGLCCHLLSIDNDFSQECDFVMVLDAEGFRAPEFADSSTVRDNEMATFIVGLSDLTIVNVEGENWSEMQNILEVVVYALLRIRQTKHSMKFMPSCMFVHQKISAQDFLERTQSGRHNQMTFLNEMVKSAAQREGYDNITAFKDLVYYDDKVDLHVFPGIWLGNHPFSAFNPEYCRAAARLKAVLVEKIKGRSSCLKFDDLCRRMFDLWDSIRQENFVFNFKCTRETLAYLCLASEFSKIRWNLRIDNLKMVTNVVDMISATGKCEELYVQKSSFRSELENKLARTSREAVASLQEAFLSIQYEDIAEKFRGNFQGKLDRLKKDEQRKAKDTFERFFVAQERKLRDFEIIEPKVKRFISDLLQNVKSTSAGRVSKSVDKRWEEEFSEEEKHYKRSVELAMKSIDDAIRNQLPPEAKRVYDTNGNDLSYPEVQETDITRKIFGITNNSGHTIRAVKEELRNLCDNCKLYLEGLKGLDFHISHVESVLKPVLKYFGFTLRERSADSLQQETSRTRETDDGELSHGSNLTKDYAARNIAFIGRYTCNKLISVAERLILKTEAYVDLKNRYVPPVKEMLNEKEPEFFLAQYILEKAKLSTSQNLDAIVLKILQQRDASFATKTAFLARLLCDLAVTEDFACFTDFFRNFDEFFKNQLLHFIHSALNEDLVRSRIINSANEDMQILIRDVQKDVISSLEESQTGTSNPEMWLCNIREKLHGKIDFCPNDVLVCFQNINERTKESEYLQKIREKVNKYLKYLLATIDCSGLFSLWEKTKMTHGFLKNLHEQISGCCERCPFCSAPCLEQTKNRCSSRSPHYSLHYPVGVQGIVVRGSFHEVQSSKKNSQVTNLAIRWCPLLIQSTDRIRTVDRYNSFYHRWFDWNWIFYKDYQKEFPDWFIPQPSQMESGANDYWKWFLVRFGDQFARSYSASCPDISSDWELVSRERAAQSIIELLQNYETTRNDPSWRPNPGPIPALTLTMTQHSEPGPRTLSSRPEPGPRTLSSGPGPRTQPSRPEPGPRTQPSRPEPGPRTHPFRPRPRTQPSRSGSGPRTQPSRPGPGPST